MMDMAARALAWAIWLTRFRSITGSEGERDLPAALAEKLRGDVIWRDCEIWPIAAQDDPMGRSCLAALARGRGDQLLLLTGHFDTVPVDDYGELRDLATEPDALREALLLKLRSPSTPAEALARSDFESGLFLPGRGLLDMKSGLAAGLAAIEAFLQDPERTGNLLFVAVPDEEVSSIGARALAVELPQIARDRGLRLAGAINLDCIGDRGDGTVGRAVALGSVGKLLPTALVIGQPTHASHPLQGLNAAALAGAIAARLEWARELTDDRWGHADGLGIPPTLLSLKDSKRHYDVTTPESCFACWNVLSLGRSEADVLSAFEGLVTQAVAAFLSDLARRQPAAPAGDPGQISIPVIRAAHLMAEARRQDGGTDQLAHVAERLRQEGISLPDQNERLTLEAWAQSGRSGPAVIVGFGSLPYPHVEIGDNPLGKALLHAIEIARGQAFAESGTTIDICRHFPGISDMSFLGEADTSSIAMIADNTPAWASGIRWSGDVVGVPCVNIGPWGRDYHTPLERVETSYAFEVLPLLLLNVARARFGMALHA